MERRRSQKASSCTSELDYVCTCIKLRRTTIYISHKPWSKHACRVDTAISYSNAGQVSKLPSVRRQYPDLGYDVEYRTCIHDLPKFDINADCKRDRKMARIQNRRDNLSSVRNVAKFCQVYSCMDRPSRGARKESTMTRLTLPSTEV